MVVRMFIPSEKVCKLIIKGCTKFIKAAIGEQTGVVPSEEEILAMWEKNGQEMRKSLGREVERVLADMHEAGVQYGLERNTDYFIELMDADKHFRPGVEKQFLEVLAVPDADLTEAMLVLGVELYNYLKKNAQGRYVSVELDGTMYLDCTPKTYNCIRD